MMVMEILSSRDTVRCGKEREIDTPTEPLLNLAMAGRLELPAADNDQPLDSTVMGRTMKHYLPMIVANGVAFTTPLWPLIMNFLGTRVPSRYSLVFNNLTGQVQLYTLA